MVVFVSEGEMIAVVLEDRLRDEMIAFCVLAGRRETGGILIGHYSDLYDQALVTEVTGPPSDSRAGRWWFVRGVRGLSRALARAWRSHDYYLGEWHSHPFADATPSDTDREQIVAFARDPAYACPQPILLVVGGNPGASPAFAAAVVVDNEVCPLYVPPGELEIDGVQPAQTRLIPGLARELPPADVPDGASEP